MGLSVKARKKLVNAFAGFFTLSTQYQKVRITENIVLENQNFTNGQKFDLQNKNMKVKINKRKKRKVPVRQSCNWFRQPD